MVPDSSGSPDLSSSSDDVANEPELRQLAQRYGVSTEYWDWQGRRVPVSVKTVVAVLAAFGVPASTTTEIAESVRAAEMEPWLSALPSIVIARAGQPASVLVHVPPGSAVSLRVRCEDGTYSEAVQVEHDQEPVDVADVLTSESKYALPLDLPLGWHILEARVEGDQVAECPVVVSPQRLEWPAGLGEERVWGLMAQLYSVRSARSWGVGDFADLADLAAVGADLGAEFVLVNPLHAAEPVPPVENSPYLPTTRRFVNPLYIRVHDIPEVAYLSTSEQSRLDALATVVQDSAASSELIDRQACLAAKLDGLTTVHAQPRSIARSRLFGDYKRREGDGLVQFARWSALREHFGSAPWPDWATDATSSELGTFAAQNADRVDFFCWLQWIADEQLAAAQRVALDMGMRTGLITDLAVGVHPAGADAWSLGSTLATGVSVGAPPDAFNQLGQDWSQPPWRPDMLAKLAYQPYRDMLRSVLRHCGGLRIDHVMGLFRLWCIPSGARPDEGAYVRYDYEAMVSILLLEAHRAGAFVVGEDLGVVEPFVRDYLAERGVAGTSILWFERDDGGWPRPPESYRELCLATVATHDLPPTAGYLAGEHIKLRERLGLLTRSVDEEAAVDARDRGMVIEALKQRGLVGESPSIEDLIAALHAYLALGPSKLLGVLVTDLVGDMRTQNQPGTSTEYPNWRIPLADESGTEVLVEDLAVSRRARRLADVMNQGTRPR